jgi:hypothetical protein
MDADGSNARQVGHQGYRQVECGADATWCFASSTGSNATARLVRISSNDGAETPILDNIVGGISTVSNDGTMIGAFV